MDLSQILHSTTFTWVILPVLIFMSRICDVTIGTMRVIFVTRGFRWYAALLGFVEVFIWLVAIGQIMKNLNNVVCYVAYAGGYATGTFVGVWLEGKLSLGKVVLRVVAVGNHVSLVQGLRAVSHNVVCLDAQLATGDGKIVLGILRRQDLPRALEIVKDVAPSAFYSVEDVRLASSPGLIRSVAEVP